ncbi:Panacea domain-containing protein [Geobacillus thermodenitrificans]|uniref:Panacea domain-containing protein n=1 Tax=Geobacillus thermodenitrificans TaxID=33940 RepID=UPI0035B54914
MAKIYYLRGKMGNMLATVEVEAVTNVYDVAKTFLTFEPMTHKKLQKLCYYAYSWYLTLYGKRLFNNRIEAWVHGPVCPDLYHEYKHYGWQEIETVNELPKSIAENPDVYEFIKEVFESYGHLNGDELEYLTHMEEPWKEARGDLGDLEPCTEKIKDEVIIRFYRKVLEDEQKD